MSTYEVFKDLLFRVFSKDTLISVGIILFLLFLLSPIIDRYDGDRNLSKPKGDGKKNADPPLKDGGEYPM